MSHNLVLALLTIATATVPGSTGETEHTIPVHDFERGFDFAYLSFEKTVKVEEGVARIRAKDGKGGAGAHSR